MALAQLSQPQGVLGGSEVGKALQETRPILREYPEKIQLARWAGNGAAAQNLRVELGLVGNRIILVVRVQGLV